MLCQLIEKELIELKKEMPISKIAKIIDMPQVTVWRFFNSVTEKKNFEIIVRLEQKELIKPLKQFFR